MFRASVAFRALAALTAPLAVAELSRPTVTLDDALDGLERFGALDADVARTALQCVVSLDTDDEATALVAGRRRHLFAAARAHGSVPFVGEAVCRSIANMAMLADSTASAEATQHSTAGVVTYATALAQEECVQIVLSVLERGERLSAKGRAWSAMALLNLCMFDDAAAHTAANSSADVAAAHLVRLILRDPDATSPTNQAALDAALAVIPRLLSLQTGDNANTAHRYQVVSFAVVEAITEAIAAKVTLSATHKAWEALRLIASHPANHTLVFNALHAADGRAGSRVLRDWMASAQEGLKEYRVDLDAATDPEAHQVQTLQRHVLLSGLETLTAVTSTAAHARDGASGAAASSEEDHQENDNSAHHGEEDRASATVTASAVLSSGGLSSFIVSILTSTAPQVLAPANADFPSGRDETVVIGCATLLGNLADSDPYVNSANCVAALKPWIAAHGQYSSAVVDRVLTVLWNIMNSREGADAANVLGVKEVLKPLAADPKAAASSRTGAERLLKKIDAAIDNPRYAFSDKR